MKLLDINGTVHLPTFTNDKRGWVEHEGAMLAQGFTHTSCARVFSGGLDTEAGLDLVDCPGCLESSAFKQAQMLVEMMDE